ncbi:MAG: hypothetical protein ABIL45_04365 [candidate division WOR-3 bacterium]
MRYSELTSKLYNYAYSKYKSAKIALFISNMTKAYVNAGSIKVRQVDFTINEAIYKDEKEIYKRLKGFALQHCRSLAISRPEETIYLSVDALPIIMDEINNFEYPRNKKEALEYLLWLLRVRNNLDAGYLYLNELHELLGIKIDLNTIYNKVKYEYNSYVSNYFKKLLSDFKFKFVELKSSYKALYHFFLDLEPSLLNEYILRAEINYNPSKEREIPESYVGGVITGCDFDVYASVVNVPLVNEVELVLLPSTVQKMKYYFKDLKMSDFIVDYHSGYNYDRITNFIFNKSKEIKLKPEISITLLLKQYLYTINIFHMYGLISVITYFSALYLDSVNKLYEIKGVKKWEG